MNSNIEGIACLYDIGHMNYVGGVYTLTNIHPNNIKIVKHINFPVE